MAPVVSPTLVPSKSIWRQTLRRSSLNAMTWLAFDVPATFVRFSRASAKRWVILMTEVMAMATASGEKEPGGYWEEPRSGPRSETVRFYRSCNWSFGDLEANGVGTSAGCTS